jgi:hypothetical protein
LQRLQGQARQLDRPLRHAKAACLAITRPGKQRLVEFGLQANRQRADREREALAGHAPVALLWPYRPMPGHEPAREESGIDRAHCRVHPKPTDRIHCAQGGIEQQRGQTGKDQANLERPENAHPMPGLFDPGGEFEE